MLPLGREAFAQQSIAPIKVLILQGNLAHPIRFERTTFAFGAHRHMAELMARVFIGTQKGTPMREQASTSELMRQLALKAWLNFHCSSVRIPYQAAASCRPREMGCRWRQRIYPPSSEGSAATKASSPKYEGTLNQIAQGTSYNRLHEAQERCARWLLTRVTGATETHFC
jgi:hypothetical protein